MLKKIFGALALALVAASSSAQFAPNQVLRAQDLNAALAAPTITGGSINGAPIGGTSPRGVTATTVYAGTVTSPKFVGTITGVVTGTATYAASAGTATYAVSAGTATTASTAARATTATYATNAGTATLASTATAAGTATYATNAGNAYQLNGTTFAAPGPIGATTPSTGAFSTLRASSTDASPAVLGVNGTTKGVRFRFGSSAANIEAVDNTLTNFQPLLLVGSTTGVFSAGSGAVTLGTDNGTAQAYVAHTASAANALVFTGGAAGSPVAISTFGADTNRAITVTPAGTGTVAVVGPLSANAQKLNTYTYAGLPAASTLPGYRVRVSDIGIAPGMALVSDGARWVPDGVQVLARGAVPMILPSSGSIGNNGALTGLTALPTTYPAAYMYFPADAIAAGVPAGLYYVVMSSTTAGTIYNNTYTSGSPVVPASPTAFATTGPGAYTQTTGADVSLFTATVPANLMGLYGGVRSHAQATSNNSVGVKTVRMFLGGTGGSNYATGTNTTNVTLTDFRTILNKGVTNRQSATSSAASWSGLGSIGGSVASSSIDTTAATTLVYTAQLATATDYCLFNVVLVESLP